MRQETVTVEAGGVIIKITISCPDQDKKEDAPVKDAGAGIIDPSTFDPRRVTWKLLDIAAGDFGRMLISYNGVPLKYIKMKDYSNGSQRFCPKERGYLLDLAMAYKSGILTPGRIRKGDNQRASQVNRLFRAIFPFYVGANPAISHNAGRLNIVLDTE